MIATLAEVLIPGDCRIPVLVYRLLGWDSALEQTNTVTDSAVDDEANPTAAQAKTMVKLIGQILFLPLANK